MISRKEIERRIEKKQEEILEHEKNIELAKSYIQALQELLKLLPKEATSQASVAIILRPGSTLEKVRALLLKTGKPLYIEEILKGIGKDVTKESRNALAGSLGGYARRGSVFTRPQPGTFGLVEFSAPEPPEDFGDDAEKTSTSDKKE